MTINKSQVFISKIQVQTTNYYIQDPSIFIQLDLQLILISSLLVTYNQPTDEVYLVYFRILYIQFSSH